MLFDDGDDAVDKLGVTAQGIHGLLCQRQVVLRPIGIVVGKVLLADA